MQEQIREAFIKFFLMVLLGIISISGCTSGKQNLRDYKGTYLESVKLNFEAGEEALRANDYDRAITYFQFVRSKYPFSKYAALSDLRIADVKFAQKKWLDAASAYEVFIRLHPRNEEVAYASYRLGISYFHAIPSDFFLLPKSTERDQSFTKEALSAIERFIVRYPTSEYIDDAKKKRALLFSNLAKHSQYIADYYEMRGHYQAAIDRHLSVYNLYPETDEATESLFHAAEIYAFKLKDEEHALPLYMQIIDEKPDSPLAKKARTRIERIESDK